MVAPARHSNGEFSRDSLPSPRKTSVLVKSLGILAEILVTVAVLCATYLSWQVWWTGVQAERVQQETRQQVSWSLPKDTNNVKIASPMEGEAPLQDANAPTNALIAQVYIPRFGDQWQRNVVQGVTLAQLNLHGLGHYPETQMPGQIGNFAVAGHRNGYGQPLGDVDALQPGDPIVVRTKDYWYVYRYTSHEIVTPEHSEVIAAVPDRPGDTPTKAMITLTTCEPKYSAPIYRWISYGELAYWTKAADGVPQELTTANSSGGVQFINNETASIATHIPSLKGVLVWLAIAYIILFIAAAVAFKWPIIANIRQGLRRRPDPSFYGFFWRVQPGVIGIRLIMTVLALLMFVVVMYQWVCPWAAATIPVLRDMSNFVVTN